MLILGIDTSTEILSVALCHYDEEEEEHETLALVVEETKNNQSEILMSRIDQVVKEAKIKLSDLDRIAIGIGPGSYTGVRVGVTAAKTLAYALGIPITPISSLKVMQYCDLKYFLRIPMIDAKRGNIFASGLDATKFGNTVIPEGLYQIDELIEEVKKLKFKDIAFIGSGAVANKDKILELNNEGFSVGVIKELDLKQTKAEHLAFDTVYDEDTPPVPVHEVVPNYLRKTDAEISAGV